MPLATIPTPQALHDLAHKLRSAVLGEDHARAERLVQEYTQALREFWSTLSESDRAASEIPKIAQELLNWTRQMTLVQRALAARQLSIIHRARGYQAAGRSQTPSAGVQLRG
jgi:hypothetical protein